MLTYRSFKQAILENVSEDSRKNKYLSKLPKEPGTAPIPEGHVRLYHQTREENLDNIEKEGIKMSKARGIEGPSGIWHHKSGFYGKPTDEPTVEFSIPEKEHKELYGGPLKRDIKPHEIIGIHRPWHKHARYIMRKPHEQIESLKNDKYINDHIDNNTDDPTIKAMKHIKEHY